MVLAFGSPWLWPVGVSGDPARGLLSFGRCRDRQPPNEQRSKGPLFAINSFLAINFGILHRIQEGEQHYRYTFCRDFGNKSAVMPCRNPG